MKYKCQVCGYVYDESKEKIPFDQLADDWKCPLCGAPKSAFKAEEEEKSNEVAEKAEERVSEPENITVSEGDRKLSSGQLAALCSNLARGCEKQYMAEEADLFRKIADYLSNITPPVADAGVEFIEASLKKDIEEYPDIRKIADADKDRGAARALTWGEKVSRMLSSLTERYLKEGESMLEDQDVWLCTACGFVYIGEKAPDLCPVCKVPSWKFEKIEGRV